jgi:hypothetical protein
MDKSRQTNYRSTLYLVYGTSLLNGSVVEDTVVANDQEDAYRKARDLYPREQFDVAVYLQSTDDD